MNAVRSVMTLFLLSVAALCVAGWMWAGKQPSPTMEGARIAISLCLAMALGAIALIWSAKQPEVK